MKRLRIIGSTLRARSIAAKAAVMDELRQRVWPKLESGEIKTVVDTVLPITQAEQAHQRMADDHNVGKIVMTVG